MTVVGYSNVLFDVLTEDPLWYPWSSQRLAEVADAEPHGYLTRASLPWEAAFLAGRCFVTYRRRQVTKISPWPDFHIGAHAAARGMRLLTRDTKRYSPYFPRLEVIAP